MNQIFNNLSQWFKAESIIIDERTGFTFLAAIALGTVLLWQVPTGRYILYPFTILGTWFHEMGHGLMALLLGANFRRLILRSNGDGIAYFSYRRGCLLLGPIGRVFIAAAGPMGPPIIGAGMIVASRDLQSSHRLLTILGIFMLITVVVWVRNAFGVLVMTAIAIAILLIATQASLSIQALVIQIIGVQACVSTFRDFNYLFRSHNGTSDTARIAQILFLPYWFWGAVITTASILLLANSLSIAYFGK